MAQHHSVIEAARRAGLQLLAYTSLLHADQSPLGLAPEHLATEELLRASGLSYVLLRNGWYSENYTSSIPTALTHRALLGSAERFNRFGGACGLCAGGCRDPHH